MKKAKWSVEKIISILKESESGVSVAELCRRHGMSDAAFYNWRKRYGGMEVSEARRLKELEEENGKLKRLLAENMLELTAARDLLRKNF
jgi:putative transposase